MSVDDLYQEIILDHYRSPRSKRACDHGAVTQVHHDNPLCGDELDLFVQIEDGRIRQATFQGQGCAISQASASMMTEAVCGKTVAEALSLGETMREMMHGHPPSTELGDLDALEGVAKFPVRVKCALLAWVALRDALERGGKT
jgi:nitrogen fixation protein NifU and related proteins